MADLMAKSQPIVPTALPEPPFVSIEGVPNFRDLGGYACKPEDSDGNQIQKSTRRGYLFRSAQLSGIKPAGIEKLISELKVHDIYDFRSDAEIQLVASRYPDAPRSIDGTTRHAIPVYRHGDFSPVSLAKKYGVYAPLSGQSGETVTGGFVHAYQDISGSAAENGSFKQILLHILQHPDEPLLFHCTAGKDRTGVFSALLLKLCGVDDVDVAWDYSLTTHGLGSWREHLIQRMMGEGGHAVKSDEGGKGENGKERLTLSREDAERVVGSQAEDMLAFLNVVQDKFGGARTYFRERCGLSDAELDQIVESLTVEREPYLPPKQQELE